jgi:hypothetical protein
VRYEVEVKVCGGGYEAVATFGNLTELPSREKVEELKEATVMAFPLWFPGAKPETVAACKRPVQESEDPGRITD